jgi:hypothetical protein
MWGAHAKDILFRSVRWNDRRHPLCLQRDDVLGKIKLPRRCQCLRCV